MSKFLYLVLLVAALGGGWYFYTHYEITGLEGLGVRPRGAGPQANHSGSTAGPLHSAARPPKQPAGVPRRDTIRVATFNFDPLDHRKLGRRHVTGRLVQIVRQFDILAVQNVQASNRGPLMQLLEQVNSAGRRYDFAVADEVGRQPVEQYQAFLFDRATVQIDRSTVYRVKDETGSLRRPPLVASFRVDGPRAAEAFTFTLINVHNDANRAITELDLLDDVFRAVRDDGRGEDDVILLGDLGGDGQNLGQLGQIPHIICAASGIPSTLSASRLVDNLLLDRVATAEFTGRAGVMDLMQRFNLPMQEALEISGHFPVWAEFSAYEGGQAGHVAAAPR